MKEKSIDDEWEAALCGTRIEDAGIPEDQMTLDPNPITIGEECQD